MKTVKNHGQIWLSLMITVFMLLSIFATASNMNADDKKTDDKKAKSEVSRFLIKTSHTSEQCLKSLDDYAANNPALLKKIDWGCMVGDHTGYVVVEAANETAARNMLPANERKSAKIVQLNKFTVEQIKEYHKKM
jgi:hypothetical protein